MTFYTNNYLQRLTSGPEIDIVTAELNLAERLAVMLVERNVD
jgi:hypothetical protein